MALARTGGMDEGSASWYNFASDASQPYPVSVTQSSGWTSGYASTGAVGFSGSSDPHHIHSQIPTRRRSSSGEQHSVMNFTVNVNLQGSNNGGCAHCSSGESTQISPLSQFTEIVIRSQAESIGPLKDSHTVRQSQPDCREEAFVNEDSQPRGGQPQGLPSAYQEVLEYFTPQLMQYMDPLTLYPYLLSHRLITYEDVDYICNPLRTERERRSRILITAPYKEPKAFEHFLQSLSEEPEHTGHKYLARRLREALEKKRQNPYRQLSNLMPRPSSNFDTEEQDGCASHPSMVPTQQEESTPRPKRVRVKRDGTAAQQQPRLHKSSSSSSESREVIPDAVLHSAPPTAKPEACFFPEGTAASSVRMSFRGSDEKLIKKKLEWLQKRVYFKDCPEYVRLSSKTHFCEDRELLYSGILHEHGKPRFVVLFTDMLLVMKVKKPHGSGKLGSVFTSSPSKLEWFADREYSAKKPLQLHLLTVKQQRRQEELKEICLHYKNGSEVKEICLVACSVEAKKVWVEQLSDAIKACTTAHAETVLPVGKRVPKIPGGKSYTKLTVGILRLINVALAEGTSTHSIQLYCKMTVGDKKCRTPVTSSMPPTWNFSSEFLDFSRSENLLIELYNENVFRPDDLVSSVKVRLSSLPEGPAGIKASLHLKRPNREPMGELQVHIESGWETKM